MQKPYCTFSNAVSKNVKRSSLAFGLFLLFAGTPSFAVLPGIGSSGPVGSPSASATPDLAAVPMMNLQEATKNAAKTYQIGDRINLLAEVNSPGLENGDKLTLKVPEGSSKLEDQGWYIDPSSQFLGGVFRFIVSPIQTGSLTLPTLLITKEDGTTVGRTAPYQIQVAGPETKDQQKEAELLDITSSSLPAKYWVLFALITLVVMGGVSYGIYRYLKTRRKKPSFIPKTQADPEHVVALRKINELYLKYPYEIENLKPVAFGVSETLKEFFSRRFKVDAAESTSDEMIELLRKEAISGESLREIQTLFQDLDLVKFTKSENYSHFDAGKYQDLKVKSQLIIQKWTLKPVEPKGPQV